MTFLKTIQRGLILFAFLLMVAFWQSGLVLAQEENVEVATQVDDDDFFDDFDDLTDYEGISTGSSFADKYIRGRLGLRFGMAAQRAGRHASIPLWLARADKLDLGPVPEGEKWVSMAKGNVWVFGVDYQLTDSLTINLSVPYIFMKFIADPAFRELHPYDDNASADMRDQYSFHDASFNLSYIILGYPDYPVSLSASTGYSLPLVNYPTMGHSAIGTRQKSIPIGLSVSRPLSLTGPVLSRTYVMAGYKVEFMSKALDQRLNRGTYNVATSYTPFDFMSVGVSWTYAYIYGMGVFDTMELGLYDDPGGWLPDKYLDASEEEISAYVAQIGINHDRLLPIHTGLLAYQLTFSFGNLPPFDITYFHSLAPYTQLTMHNRNLMVNTRWSF